MATKLEQLKDKLQKARSEHAAATAVMGEVQSNIAKEIETLGTLGVVIPDKNNFADDGAWYEAIQAAANDFIDKKEADNKAQIEEIEAIMAKWEA